MDKFCIITNIDKDKDLTITNLIKDYLQTKKKVCLTVNAMSADEVDSKVFTGIECLLVLGGDGTLIQAARDFVGKNIPLIGINLGTLGFLTSVEKEDITTCLDALIADEYSIENRIMLEGKVYHEDKLIKQSVALNDIIITRSGFSRLVEVKLFINEKLVDIYNGDGMIISTPTGSTGYNLSAGGPVVFPETELILATPICPHSLSARSIVVSAKDKITMEMGLRKKTQREEAIVTYDGQTAIELSPFDRVEIRKADVLVQTIKVNGASFYEILRSKIGNFDKGPYK